MNRTEFKVMFALAVTSDPMSANEIAKQTGLSKRAVTVGASLEYQCKRKLIVKENEKFAFNDSISEWDIKDLTDRKLYETQTSAASVR
jgi:DNA-binding transcriptional regulator GbsR (MarR family)